MIGSEAELVRSDIRKRGINPVGLAANGCPLPLLCISAIIQYSTLFY